MKNNSSARCRLCLSTDQEQYSIIYDQHEPERLADIIYLCFGIRIGRNDGITQVICDPCRMDVIHFYDFRKRCLAADTVLRNERDELGLKSCSPLNNTGPGEDALDIIESSGWEDHDHVEGTTIEEAPAPEVQDDCVVLEAPVAENYLETDELICELPDEGDPIVEGRLETDETLEEVEFLIESDELQALNDDEDSNIVTDAQCNAPSETFAEAESELQTLNSDDDSDELSDARSNSPLEPYAEAACEDFLRFVCCGCNATEFNSQEELDAHRNERHQRYRVRDCTIRPFECDKCFKRFIKEKHLAHHQERPFRKRRFVCVSCGLAYFTNTAMLRHEKLCLGKEKKTPCTLCGKQFRGRISILNHMRIHQQDKVYPCTVCGKTFKSKWAVPIHMVTHSTEQPFRCDICPAKFKREASMKTHERRHANPLPHKCDFCDESFNNNAARKYHRLTVHEGLDPYRCEECGISYKRKLMLKHHMERVHGHQAR
ncbi:zinc finger and SCAN domain-containing protein 12-like [Anopheles aquasalis]|uniref:zinc finger and SCAN domain-containing protein 12-like n=1 Tax=Anopheles aquasalis TaxID=42839 RepID=UPI00215A2E52|nr:zinc finger and SCAN domain-containing protein 12-like [Anopheles aquasalis]